MCAGENVCLIVADTDLLIMLICVWNDMMGQIKMKSEGTRKYKDIFCNSNATLEQIGAAGLRIFVLLYGGKDTDNLSSLRYAKYMKMASTTSSVKPEKFPQQREQQIFILFVFIIKYKNGTL